MIILTSDFNPERAEADYEADAQTMLYMCLFAAGYTTVDISTHKYNVVQHVKAIQDEPNNPDVGKLYMVENDKKLTEYGVHIENIIQPASEDSYPMIVTSVYNGFESYNLVAQINRPLVCDEENVHLYENNTYGYGRKLVSTSKTAHKRPLTNGD